MAKPDWGELQQRFLSEHATTGVSPKEWCEAQGLNYATARRYIKKPAAQKSAQERMHTAQKDKSTDELVDIKLSAKVKRFIAEYLKDNNATAAAARAGYSDPNYGRQLIANPNVAQAIAQQQKASIARTLGSADEVLAQMWQLATFDANQLSQYRRGACRYCWGFGHHYQSSKRKDSRLLSVTDVNLKIPVVTAMTTIESPTLNARAATAMVLASLTSRTPGNSLKSHGSHTPA